MKIVVSSDARTHLVDAVLDDLGRRGHEVAYLGPGEGEELDWPEVSLAAAERVAGGAADEAVVMCWTGTGAALAANKVPGVRAALCRDAETAKGARIWNHANVLALSLRSTPVPVATEILAAWFETPFSDDDWNLNQMQRIRDAERKHGGSGKP